MRLDASKVERARRTVWWTGGSLTLTKLFDMGIDFVLRSFEMPSANLVDPETGDAFEKPAGEPYPPRS